MNEIPAPGAGPKRSDAKNPGKHDDLRVWVEKVDREVIARKLPVGAIVTARVLESQGDGRFIIGLAGLRVTAESAMDLAVGERLNARVAALEPQVRLNLMKPGADVLDEILGRFGYQKPTPEMREAVAAFLDGGLPLDRETIRRAAELMQKGMSARNAVRHIANELPSTSSVTARTLASEQSVAQAFERLSTALGESGRGALAESIRDSITFAGDLGELFEKHPLKFERRLLGPDPKDPANDAKALLIKISREDSPNGIEPGPGDAARAAHDLLETLEGRYLAGEPVRQIPFLVDDEGLQDGWISAERSSGRTNVRWKLGTSRLGEVVGVVDFVNRAAGMDRHTAGISIGVKDAETRKALLAKSAELIESLKARGIRIDSLTVEVLKRDPPEPHRPIGLDLKV